MHVYSAEGQTPAGTTLTIAEVVSPGTTRRAWIELFTISSDAAPADIATEFNLIRGTVSGTGTSVTPRVLDPGNPAAIFTFERGTFTGQTKTANSAMFNMGLNQRSSYAHYYAPGREVVVPAVADNWVGVESIASGGTPNINCMLQWHE